MSKILFENEIAFTVSVKNESQYIGEWIEYHFAIGVDKFYVYNNESEDRDELIRVLQPWIERGIVELNDISGRGAQIPAYFDALENHRFDCRYMGFFDIDEFVFVKDRSSLIEFINSIFNASENINALGIDMRIFGSSGKLYRESGGVLERFTRRQRDDNGSDLVSSKLIANPRFIALTPTPHYFFHYWGKHSVNENLLQLKNRIPTTYNSTQKIQLNHYITKSKEEFQAKTSRGGGTGTIYNCEQRFRQFDLNDVEDRSLLDYWNQLKKFPRRDRYNKIVNHEQIVLMNVIEMLESPFEVSVEKYLTCFMLAKKLKSIDESDKNFLMNLSLDNLLKSTQSRLRIFDALMLFDLSHEFALYKTETSRKILIGLLNVIPDLLDFYRSLSMWQDYYHLLNRQKTLSTFLSII